MFDYQGRLFFLLLRRAKKRACESRVKHIQSSRTTLTHTHLHNTQTDDHLAPPALHPHPPTPYTYNPLTPPTPTRTPKPTYARVRCHPRWPLLLIFLVVERVVYSSVREGPRHTPKRRLGEKIRSDSILLALSNLCTYMYIM